MENALLRDDGADQERAQKDDWHRAPADALEMMHNGAQAQPCRTRECVQNHHRQRAEEMGEQYERPDDFGDSAAEAIERDQDAVGRLGVVRRALVDKLHLVDQAAIVVRRIDDAHGRAPRCERALEALDQPGAERVQPFEFCEIDVNAARVLVAAGGGIDDSLKLCGALSRPRAGSDERHALAPSLLPSACRGEKESR